MLQTMKQTTAILSGVFPVATIQPEEHELWVDRVCRPVDPRNGFVKPIHSMSVCISPLAATVGTTAAPTSTGV